jgi:XTP/dITP diphosphohydrolase
MPALALADKLVGRAAKVGVRPKGLDDTLAPADENELGALLLAIVTSARSRGLDAERALRMALRDVQDQVRVREADADRASVRPLPES